MPAERSELGTLLSAAAVAVSLMVALGLPLRHGLRPRLPARRPSPSPAVIGRPGSNDAFGHVTLDLVTGLGSVTISGGNGVFRGFSATVAVSPLGWPDFAWDGTYLQPTRLNSGQQAPAGCAGRSPAARRRVSINFRPCSGASASLVCAGDVGPNCV